MSTQQQVAEVYYEEIDEFLGKVEKFSLEKRESLMSRLHWLTVAAAVLPLIMAAISAYLAFLLENALTALVSIFDVAPPLFIVKGKNDIDYENKGLTVKHGLIGLKKDIKRLVLLGEFDGDARAEIDSEMDGYRKFFSSSS